MAKRKIIVELIADTDESFEFIKKDLEQEISSCSVNYDSIEVKEVKGE